MCLSGPRLQSTEFSATCGAPCTWEAEANRALWVQAQPVLYEFQGDRVLEWGRGEGEKNPLLLLIYILSGGLVAKKWTEAFFIHPNDSHWSNPLNTFRTFLPRGGGSTSSTFFWSRRSKLVIRSWSRGQRSRLWEQNTLNWTTSKSLHFSVLPLRD